MRWSRNVVVLRKKWFSRVISRLTGSSSAADNKFPRSGHCISWKWVQYNGNELSDARDFCL